MARQEMGDDPKEYPVSYVMDLAWCAAGIRAIIRSLSWYRGYKNNDDPHFEEDVAALEKVIDLLTEPIENFLFSGRGR
jgi:hypothetical protein